MHVAVPPDVKFTHIGAEFPSALDEDIEWHAQQIESTSRIYRAAKRKNEPEAALKDKAKQLYEAIKDMFKYVKHLKDKELEDQLRYIQDSHSAHEAREGLREAGNGSQEDREGLVGQAVRASA